MPNMFISYSLFTMWVEHPHKCEATTREQVANPGICRNLSGLLGWMWCVQVQCLGNPSNIMHVKFLHVCRIRMGYPVVCSTARSCDSAAPSNWMSLRKARKGATRCRIPKHARNTQSAYMCSDAKPDSMSTPTPPGFPPPGFNLRAEKNNFPTKGVRSRPESGWRAPDRLKLDARGLHATGSFGN